MIVQYHWTGFLINKHLIIIITHRYLIFI